MRTISEEVYQKGVSLGKIDGGKKVIPIKKVDDDVVVKVDDDKRAVEARNNPTMGDGEVKSLLRQNTQLIKSLKDKIDEGGKDKKLTINRDSAGFIASIDVTIKK